MEENEILEETKEPEIIIVRDIRREAICLMLGLDTGCTDDELLTEARKFKERLDG